MTCGVTEILKTFKFSIRRLSDVFLEGPKVETLALPLRWGARRMQSGVEECGLFWWLRQQRNFPQCRRPGFSPWIGKIPCRREWLPTPRFLPREFHGQRSLEGYRPWGCKESDATERPHTHTHTRALNAVSGARGLGHFPFLALSPWPHYLAPLRRRLPLGKSGKWGGVGLAGDRLLAHNRLNKCKLPVI